MPSGCARGTPTWVFWVHAASVDTFTHSYREIADSIKVPRKEDSKDDVMQIVSRWLRDEKNGPWLMIVDNNDDAKLLFSPQKMEQGGDAKSNILWTSSIPKLIENVKF